MVLPFSNASGLLKSCCSMHEFFFLLCCIGTKRKRRKRWASRSTGEALSVFLAAVYGSLASDPTIIEPISGKFSCVAFEKFSICICGLLLLCGLHCYVAFIASSFCCRVKGELKDSEEQLDSQLVFFAFASPLCLTPANSF